MHPMEAYWHVDSVDPETHGIETICVWAANEDDAREQAPHDARVLDAFPDGECGELLELPRNDAAAAQPVRGPRAA